MAPTLPGFAPFPGATLRKTIVPGDWEACLSLWISLAEAHLALSEADFDQVSTQDTSMSSYLVSFAFETADAGVSILGTSQLATQVLRHNFFLIAQLLRSQKCAETLLNWEFLSDFSRVFGKKRTEPVLAHAFKKSGTTPEAPLHALKKSLVKSLDLGIKGDLRVPEAQLKRLNHLIHTSPDAAAFFLAGSDFLDGLISCFKIMNPPLRKIIITTMYLCLIGLTEGHPPNYSMLSDQLYSLKAAADAHKSGPTSANDSMVGDLVTTTPILKQVLGRLDDSSSTTTRIKSVIAALEAFRKPGGMIVPKRLIKRKIDKGKGVLQAQDDEELGQMRVHRMSQISQIQDLFPDLGSAFVSKLLDEYDSSTEQVITHLLEESLPPYLASEDRKKELSPERPRRRRSSLAPRPTPPQLPVRHNVHDDDDFDRLAIDTSRLHFGKHNPNKTADDVLRDRSTAPNKAAILSALSAFDADDDERDDTYDAADAGFNVNDALADDADDQKRKDSNEEILFKAYQADLKLFDRDSDTRRGNYRAQLKQETGMTDEAIEGWAVMLGRNPQQMKSLELKYSTFNGNQSTLASTAWRAGADGSDAEEAGQNGANGNDRGGFRGRGRGSGRGRGRGGNVAGAPGDQGTEGARRRKEANKGSRANHNRRDQRARKVARAGFPG